MDILKMKDVLQKHIYELNQIGGEWAEIKVDELEFLNDRLEELCLKTYLLARLKTELLCMTHERDKLIENQNSRRPAPCEHFCEQQAFKIEIRQLRAENAELKTELLCMEHDYDELLADRDSTMSSFKNFHRLLCDRFDYSHDPIHWRRDQLILIEDIANQYKEASLKICALRAEIDEYQSEREAMMKQEPVGYKVNDTKNNSQWITTIQNPEKYKLDYPDFVLTPVYDHPLSASQPINKSNQ